MAKIDETYRDLLLDIIQNGQKKSDRTGTGTTSVFGRQLRHSMKDGFPILTTKRVHFKSVLGELLWFLDGSTNAKDLREKYGVTIWDEWEREDGDLGPVYGKQWVDWGGTFSKDHMNRNGTFGVHFKGTNQIQEVVDQLKNNPDSRRIMVNAWNVGELNKMALPPCHYGFQLYSHEDKDGIRVLSLMWNQRSVDSFLGLPFNIASYATLLRIFAKSAEMRLGDLIGNFGDLHIYDNHMEYVKKQLYRDINKYDSPLLLMKHKKDVFSYELDDFSLAEYKAYPNWKDVPVAV
jgi:thymidylate synthase